jgi:hypothetical protein
MLQLTIKNEEGDRELRVSGENMKELIDEKLPMWLPKFEEDMRLIRQTKRYKGDPEGVEKQERESGWYYDI